MLPGVRPCLLNYLPNYCHQRRTRSSSPSVSHNMPEFIFQETENRLEVWQSSYDHLLHFQRIQAQFPASSRWYSSSGGSDGFPGLLGTYVHMVHGHACRQNTYTPKTKTKQGQQQNKLPKILNSSHGCDQMLDKSKLREEGYFLYLWFQRTQFLLPWPQAYGKNVITAGTGVGGKLPHLRMNRKSQDNTDWAKTHPHWPASSS